MTLKTVTLTKHKSDDGFWSTDKPVGTEYLADMDTVFRDDFKNIPTQTEFSCVMIMVWEAPNKRWMPFPVELLDHGQIKHPNKKSEGVAA